MNINKEIAKQILQKSLSNLFERKGNLSINDLHLEVINNASLYGLRNQREKADQGDSFNDMLKGIFEGVEDWPKIAHSFTDAALELFPKQFTSANYIACSQAILQNSAEDDMWDFLRIYFQENHEIQIDEIKTQTVAFHSSKHERYENDILTSISEVDRTIGLNFFTEGDRDILIVNITPSLLPKKSYEAESNGRVVWYNGYDRDYQFAISYNESNGIEKFLLEMPNKQLKIIYLK